MSSLDDAIAANAAKPFDAALASDPRVIAVKEELRYTQKLAEDSMRYTRLKLVDVQRSLEKLLALCKAIKAETSN